MAEARGLEDDAEEKRRWATPPPLLRDADAPGPEGLSIIGELDSPLGGLLWKTYRTILLWAETPSDERADLFHPKALERRRREIESALSEREAELRDSLDAVLSLLASPDAVSEEDIGIAARRMASWAHNRSAPRTELEFLRVAAVADPDNPRLALEVAEAAWSRMQAPMAEAWFYRAIGLARRVPDWNTYVSAYLAHGAMMLQKGSHPVARESFLKAYRRAVRQGHSGPKAAALHRLFTLEDASDNVDEAVAFASRAADGYGVDHPRLPDLARDVAYFWLQRGHDSEALGVLSELAQSLARDRVPPILGALARAAAGAGDDASFDLARTRLAKLPGGIGVAEAWLEVGRGGLRMNRPEIARDAALTAQRLARQEPGSQVGFMAGVLLEQAENGTPASTRSRKVDKRHRTLSEKLVRMLGESRH